MVDDPTWLEMGRSPREAIMIETSGFVATLQKSLARMEPRLKAEARLLWAWRERVRMRRRIIRSRQLQRTMPDVTNSRRSEAMSNEDTCQPIDYFLERLSARTLPEPPQPAISNTRLRELELEHGQYLFRSRDR